VSHESTRTDKKRNTKTSQPAQQAIYRYCGAAQPPSAMRPSRPREPSVAPGRTARGPPRLDRCTPPSSPLDTGRLRRPYSRLRGDFPPPDGSLATGGISRHRINPVANLPSELKPRSTPPSTRRCRASAGWVLDTFFRRWRPRLPRSLRSLAMTNGSIAGFGSQ